MFLGVGARLLTAKRRWQKKPSLGALLGRRNSFSSDSPFWNILPLFQVVPSSKPTSFTQISTFLIFGGYPSEFKTLMMWSYSSSVNASSNVSFFLINFVGFSFLYWP